jgi:hypothetical protein
MRLVSGTQPGLWMDDRPSSLGQRNPHTNSSAMLTTTAPARISRKWLRKTFRMTAR